MSDLPAVTQGLKERSRKRCPGFDLSRHVDVRNASYLLSQKLTCLIPGVQSKPVTEIGVSHSGGQPGTALLLDDRSANGCHRNDPPILRAKRRFHSGGG